MVHYITINDYLKEYYGKPWKNGNVFFLSKEQKVERKKFCQMILSKKIKPGQVFFSDESKIDLGSFTRDSIISAPEKKIWDQSIYKLLNRTQKNFEKSLMSAGGINYFCLSKLNKFSCDQALLLYKDSIQEIEKKHKVNIIFE